MGFTIKNIKNEQLQWMKREGVWREECPVHYSRLKVVEVNYIGFDEQTNSGELIVLDKIAENVSAIFEELFDMKFPIQSMLPIEAFGGDDVKSMQANNSSAFNGRLVARTNRWSSHAFGAAIDINPVQNPYLLLNERKELVEVIPPEGSEFLDRLNQQKGMVEEIVPIFGKYGFTEWGGNWELKPDYHHFQVPWEKISSFFPDSVV